MATEVGYKTYGNKLMQVLKFTESKILCRRTGTELLFESKINFMYFKNNIPTKIIQPQFETSMIKTLMISP